MVWNGQKVLAVVPARGGSKGIPRKNLQHVGGKSLIAHAAHICRVCEWIDRAVISTDDPALAAEAVAHGLDAPFLRPGHLAGDRASSMHAWQHAWTLCERIDGTEYGVGLLLEPSSPMRRMTDIERCLEALNDPAFAAAATISPTPAHYTPHKTLAVTDRGHIGFYRNDGADHANRHTIPAHYHRNGLCYAVRRDTLLVRDSIIETDCAAVVVDRPIVNIDEPFDLELAEFLFDRELRAESSETGHDVSLNLATGS